MNPSGHVHWHQLLNLDDIIDHSRCASEKKKRWIAVLKPSVSFLEHMRALRGVRGQPIGAWGEQLFWYRLAPFGNPLGAEQTTIQTKQLKKELR